MGNPVLSNNYMFIDFRTDYSLLNSLVSIEKLFKKDKSDEPCWAKKQGWDFVGICDDNAGGLLDFYLAAKENGIKPIIGIRFRITDKLEAPTDAEILLYAQNVNGYHNLIKLSSKASLEGKDSLLLEWLGQLNQDLLCVLPVGSSPNELRSEQGKLIHKRLNELFKDKIFYGLMNRDTAVDDIWLEKAKEKDTKYLFLSNVKYFLSEDIEAYKVLRAMNEKTILGKTMEAVYLDESLEAAKERYKWYEHKSYLQKFVDMINIEIPTPGLKVPKFAVPQPFKDSYEYIVSLCRDGYKKKLSEFPDSKQVSERMKTELDVIKKCELADYFLLVFGICQYCDNHNVPRGLGRGSVGGSLVAYLLDIHKVNPLEYGLLFERFLNPDRTRPIMFNGEQYLTDAPDIDLDIGQIQRQEVIDWLREKYGFVSKIGTYTTLSAKNCIRETVRTFGRPEYEADYASGFVESKFGKTDSVEKTYEKNQKFAAWAEKNQDIYKVILKLEGLKKNSSIHAAGILISDQNIENKAPLTLLNTTGDEFKQDVCCAYDLDLAAKSALLKVDILGIRTLNLLQDTVTLIKELNLQAPTPTKVEEVKPTEKEQEAARAKKVWGDFVAANS
jgi:DNA polymerase-3 subunit alpha